tara:strand:- start:190 stop:426 length:237 start_codon:yes stop_codon:yes gene_type:complete
MRGYFDFECDTCEKITEDFIENDIKEIVCECGGKATKTICYGMPRVALDGTDPDRVGAWDKWARIREQNAKITAKRNE